MKFKGILTDQLCMKDFVNIIATFARMSKRIVFIIQKKGLLISNIGTNICTNPTAWSEIGKDEFFTHFTMKGVDEQFDEIWLSLHPGELLDIHAKQFASALNTLKTHFVKGIVIKLTKKQFPCLSIDIDMAPPGSNNFRRLVHDIPVNVIPIREWNEHRLPTLENYDISIEMPSLKSLRTLCDKMKNLSTTIRICSISTGDLSFIVETDSAIVVSRYFNLKIDQISNAQLVYPTHGRNDNQNLEVGCHIDTKHLSLCFGSLQIPTVAMIGGLLRDKVFNIKINVRENVALYFNIQCVENSN